MTVVMGGRRQGQWCIGGVLRGDGQDRREGRLCSHLSALGFPGVKPGVTAPMPPPGSLSLTARNALKRSLKDTRPGGAACGVWCSRCSRASS